MLKRRAEFQMRKCFKMPERRTAKVVMSLADLRACLRGDWRELLGRHEIANVMKDPDDQQLLFRARKHLGFKCKRPFSKCIARDKKEDEVKKSDLKNLSLCMECKCSRGLVRTRDKCTASQKRTQGKCVHQEVSRTQRDTGGHQETPDKCKSQDTDTSTNKVFMLCKGRPGHCKCRKGFTECDLKAANRGICRICINEELKHLQRSKCTNKVITHNGSDFGPFSGVGSVEEDSVSDSPNEGDSWTWADTRPNTGNGNDDGSEEDSVNFPGDVIAPVEEGGENKDEEGDNQGDDDPDERQAAEEKERSSIDAPLVASGCGGLLVIVVIVSLVLVRRRRRSGGGDVTRENSWYFNYIIIFLICFDIIFKVFRYCAVKEQKGGFCSFHSELNNILKDLLVPKYAISMLFACS